MDYYWNKFKGLEELDVKDPKSPTWVTESGTKYTSTSGNTKNIDIHDIKASVNTDDSKSVTVKRLHNKQKEFLEWIYKHTEQLDISEKHEKFIDDILDNSSYCSKYSLILNNLRERYKNYYFIHKMNDGCLFYFHPTREDDEVSWVANFDRQRYLISNSVMYLPTKTAISYRHIENNNIVDNNPFIDRKNRFSVGDNNFNIRYARKREIEYFNKARLRNG